MSTDSGVEAEGFDAAEAFALLADETRVEILQALADTGGEPTAFATLRETVGVDDSGRFNYHLGKLVGTFVEKDEDGYRLTFAGTRVVGAVYEGTYAAGDAIDPLELDSVCPDCGAAFEFAYDDERVTVRCPDCDETVTAFGFPPGAVAGRAPADLPRQVSRHVATMLDRVRAGFCTNCSGPVAPAFDADSEPGSVLLTFECDRCHERLHTTLASVLLSEPAVVAFHHDHGVDLRGALPWSLGWLTDSTAEQVGESPPRYAVSHALDGETLRVVVDEALAVVETTRN